MSSLTKALETLFRAGAIVGALGLIAIAVMITTDVFVRWLTGRPLLGVFEFSTVLLVLVTFLPLALVIFQNKQLRVDILTTHLKGRPGALVALIDVLIGLIVFGLLFWIATEEFWKAYSGRFLLRGRIEIPTAIPNGIIVAGAFLVLVALLQRGVALLIALFRAGNPRPDYDRNRPDAE